MAGCRTEVRFKTRSFGWTVLDPSAEPDEPFGGDCALWLIEQLPRLGVQTAKEACEEDWGWVVFASLDSAHFWIGVSRTFDEDEGDPPGWVAHLHHGDFRILQRLTKAGRRAFAGVAAAVETVILSLPDVDGMTWD